MLSPRGAIAPPVLTKNHAIFGDLGGTLQIQSLNSDASAEKAAAIVHPLG